MLSLLCRIFESPNKRLPLRRVELYELCLLGLLREWKREDKQANTGGVDVVAEIRVEAKLRQLARAAHALYPASESPRLAFAGALDLQLNEAARFIEELIHDGVLIPAGLNEDSPLMFLHRTFHEYLCALDWSRSKWDGSEFDTRSREAVWRPVVVLLTAVLDHARSAALIRRLADGKHDDLFRPRLALAILSLRETAERHREELIVDRVTEEALDLWLDYFSRYTTAALVRLEEALPAFGRSQRTLSRPAIQCVAVDLGTKQHFPSVGKGRRINCSHCPGA